MAIKVNGTTVIDNSRNFTNIAGGFKTVNGTSVVGSGNISAGASTSSGAVGTYIWGRPENATNYNVGDTASNVKNVTPGAGPGGSTMPSWKHGMSGWAAVPVVPTTASGTWRAVTRSYSSGSGYYDYQSIALWVRVS